VATPQAKKSTPSKVPHVFALLFIITVIMALLTWVIPAGQFDRAEDPVTGRTLVVPNSYHAIEPNPQGIADIFTAVVSGWEQAATMIFMVFFIGGMLKMLEDTGTMKLGLAHMSNALKGKEVIALILVTTIMSLGGATGAFANPVVALIPVGIALAKGLGYDPLVGFSIIYLGAYSGFNVGFANVFTIGIAHTIAEIPKFTGLGVRILLQIICLLLTLQHIIRYANKIKKDPTASLTYDLETEHDNVDILEDLAPFTTTHAIIAVIAFAAFGLLTYGAVNLGWGISQFSAIFLAAAVIIGLVGGLGVNGTARTFVKGCSGMAYAALVIGMARSISVVMQQGNIIDTVIYWLSLPITAVGPLIGANLMYVANTVINFFIPSGSGQAVTVMPIMVPLADIAGISRQVACQAFQFGDGFSNIIIPTASTVMASLGIAGVPYERYVRWVWPLLLKFFLIGFVTLTLGVMFNWGP
jgi:uncharacterized ion transporter superfamily protein YfcC